jgi:hypothetical protein
MTITNLTDILIALALIGWIIYKQLTWQLVNPSKLWRMPIIVTIVGIVMLAQTKSLATVTPQAAAILIGELAISVGLGAVMGSLAGFRTRPQRAGDLDKRDARSGTFNPAVTVVESRTGGLGAALWVVLLLVRVGIELLVTHYYPSALLTSTGTILLVLAANRAARALVVTTRMQRKGLVAA